MWFDRCPWMHVTWQAIHFLWQYVTWDWINMTSCRWQLLYLTMCRAISFSIPDPFVITSSSEMVQLYFLWCSVSIVVVWRGVMGWDGVGGESGGWWVLGVARCSRSGRPLSEMVWIAGRAICVFYSVFSENGFCGLQSPQTDIYNRKRRIWRHDWAIQNASTTVKCPFRAYAMQ